MDEKKAACQGGFSKNTHPYSNHTARSNSIDEVIIGQDQANALIRELRADYVAPDVLFVRVQEISPSSTRLSSFFRALQKFIERVDQ
jgi:hypothetical protein